MKKVIVILSITLFLITHGGCIGIAYKKEIKKGFYLIVLDVDEDMELTMVDSGGYSFRLVPSTVFSVGCDSAFIIAKQHPRTSGISFNKNITNYYIVNTKEVVDSSAFSGTLGPLSYEEFRSQKEKLGTDVDFTITIKDLE